MRSGCLGRNAREPRVTFRPKPSSSSGLPPRRPVAIQSQSRVGQLRLGARTGGLQGSHRPVSRASIARAHRPAPTGKPCGSPAVAFGRPFGSPPALRRASATRTDPSVRFGEAKVKRPGRNPDLVPKILGAVPRPGLVVPKTPPVRPQVFPTEVVAGGEGVGRRGGRAARGSGGEGGRRSVTSWARCSSATPG